MFDEIDIKILLGFSKLKSGEECSSWEMMKRIYPRGGDPEYLKVKRKIKRMSEMGLFKINGGQTKTYTLLEEYVRYKNFNFPDGNKKAIAVFPVLIDKKWQIFEL